MRLLISLTFGACLFFTLACKKDKASKTGVPELTTIDVTNALATTAMSGGNIISNGGENIASSGICWSKTNMTPTIVDDTTKNFVASGSFTAILKNLSPSSKYYVRAYATNRLGTGYGNVITFSTGNAAPFATAVSISGDAKADVLLTGNYTYNDPEGDAESGTTFKWYAANDATGIGEAEIPGATAKTFRVTDVQQGKYIRFGVTPKASTGNSIAIEVKSAFIGAVGEGNTITFVYNEKEVTYGIIIAPSGKKWMDRNLGALKIAESGTDYQAFGDMFQWGRGADGHQLVTRTGANNTTNVQGVTGTTTGVAPYETSNGDVPITNKFIIAKENVDASGDWRTTPNDNLWQGVSGINNPCPPGWRIPTKDEWMAEGIINGIDGFSKLKLTYAGRRTVGTGAFGSTSGQYWTSTAEVQDGFHFSYFVSMTATTFSAVNSYRGYARPCRCIK